MFLIHSCHSVHCLPSSGDRRPRRGKRSASRPIASSCSCSSPPSRSPSANQLCQTHYAPITPPCTPCRTSNPGPRTESKAPARSLSISAPCPGGRWSDLLRFTWGQPRWFLGEGSRRMPQTWSVDVKDGRDSGEWRWNLSGMELGKAAIAGNPRGSKNPKREQNVWFENTLPGLQTCLMLYFFLWGGVRL